MSDEAELEALIERSARSAEFTFPWGEFATLYPKKAAECVAQWGGAPDGIFIKDGEIRPWVPMGHHPLGETLKQALLDGKPITPATEANRIKALFDETDPVRDSPIDMTDHHFACTARDGLDCICVKLRGVAAKKSAPGKVLQMAVGTDNKLVAMTESGELWAQVTAAGGWHWELIHGPTAADRQQPTEKELANGKEGT